MTGLCSLFRAAYLSWCEIAFRRTSKIFLIEISQMGHLSAQRCLSSMLSGSSNMNKITAPGLLMCSGPRRPPLTSTSNGSHYTGIRARELYIILRRHNRLNILHSWDLWWPPVWGGSYWTASLQYRALRAGTRLGWNIGRDDSASEYETHASRILDHLQESHYRRSYPHLY